MKFSQRSLRNFGLGSLLLVFTGCASGPTTEQLSRANYGRNMMAAECVAIAEQVVGNRLRDPNSAQFRHLQCYQGYWTSVPVRGMGVEFGWRQEGQVNAKNAFGGYVGFRSYYVLIRDNSVIRYCISDENGLCVPIGR